MSSQRYRLPDQLIEMATDLRGRGIATMLITAEGLPVSPDWTSLSNGELFQQVLSRFRPERMQRLGIFTGARSNLTVVALTSTAQERTDQEELATATLLGRDKTARWPYHCYFARVRNYDTYQPSTGETKALNDGAYLEIEGPTYKLRSAGEKLTKMSKKLE